MNKDGISIVLSASNYTFNIVELANQIHQTLFISKLKYEIIVVDKPTAENQKIVNVLSEKYPITLFPQDLISGLMSTKYDLICIIEPEVAYTPRIIPSMIAKLIDEDVDIVVAREHPKLSLTAKVIGKIQRDYLDSQSRIKLFKKEVIERLHSFFSESTFDHHLLNKARHAGYKYAIFDVDIPAEHHAILKRKNPSFWNLFWPAIKTKYSRMDAIPFHPNMEKEKGKGFHYNGQEYIHHSNLNVSQSAFHRLSGMQILILLALFLIITFLLALNWHATIVVFVAVLTTLYFADLLFNLYLIYRSFSKPAEITISEEEITSVTQWPTYTILCPLYKEWQVIPQFVTAMSHLDYPKDKLQVMLLLEEDDKKTIQEVKNYSLPSYFEVVIVPDSKPKTKPKASNYGLQKAKGEYIVIFDAEDVPDPLQLKKAIIAFSKASKRTICIQAKLNFYNPHQNLLTRVFTAEYSLWFDLVLTGLQSIHAPIPLGGTSNHFKVENLEKLKGWDSFNVTEDCDLGMRLAKQGYQTAVINSTTLEEANSSLKNWFGQRTRWIKGYMQTYLIHMRNPQEFIKRWNEPHVVTFQLVVGGKVLSMFINPMMWFITICYFLFRAHIGTFIESFFPAPILYMGVISLLLGNFLYIYYYMIGCAKHGHHELVKYGVLIPFYWLAMSIAAWMAFYRLIVAPHYWSKTKHGLHLANKKAVSHASKAIGKDLIDQGLTHTSLNPA